MAAAITQQQAVPVPVPVKDAAAVRKRRRRAPAGGAAADCFACEKKNMKCDRRRPYCSQCLEVGSECAGYKTQLTWGVGVASRGKLRGLSLPIAKSPPVAGGPMKKSSPVRNRAGSGAATARWTDRDDTRRNTREDARISPDLTSSTPTTPFHSYEMLSMSQPEHTSPPMAQGSWVGMHFQNMSGTSEGPRYQKLGAHLAPIPIVSRSMDSVSDIDYMSPMSHSFGRDDMPFMHSPTIMYDGYSGHGSPVPQSPIGNLMMDQRAAPTSCPGLVYAPSEQSSSLPSHIDSFEAQLSQKLMQECDNLSKSAHQRPQV